MKPLRLPSLGKALQARGPGLVLIVPSTPDGWNVVKRYAPGEVLVMQLGHDPATYAWPVKDCEVVLYTECLDARTQGRVLDALMRDGVAAVGCHHYRPAAGRGS